MTGLFTNGTTLSATALNDAINSLTLNAISSAGYTLVLADAGKLVTLSNASAQNLTIPLNASVAYATGTVIETLTIGAGTWTVTPTGGVTYTGSTSLPTGTRLRLTKTGTDTWYGSVLGGGSGLVLVASATASAVATVSINNCFTSTYDSYRIVLDLTSSVSDALNLRLRAAGTDNSASTYNYQNFSASDTSVTGARSVTQTLARIGNVRGSANPVSMWIDIYGPALARATNYFHYAADNSSSTTPTMTFYNGLHSTASAFDGFTIFPASGTITTPTNGIRVYGYSNA